MDCREYSRIVVTRSVPLLFILLLFLCVLTSCTLAAELPREGDYLREDYIKASDETGSLSQAWWEFKGEPSLIRVTLKGDSAALLLAQNFHEYWGAFIAEKGSPVISRNLGSTAFEKDVYLRRASDGTDSLIMGRGQSETVRFHYVGNAKRYMARRTLVGSYTDPAGVEYSFSENGTVSFGDTQFTFEIGLDYAERAWAREVRMRDYFQNVRTRELYEITFDDSTLSIYRTSGDMFEVVAEQPFVKLRRRGSYPPLEPVPEEMVLEWDFIQATGGIATKKIGKGLRTFIKVTCPAAGSDRIPSTALLENSVLILERADWRRDGKDIVIQIVAREGRIARRKDTWIDITELSPGGYDLYYGEAVPRRLVGSFSVDTE